MSIVTNKYTPAEMSPHELEATFAAREHTVDYLLKSLRDQIHSQTLSSHVITGPRGAGKSTIIQMVALRIRQDPELNAAWIPLVFPEEQFEMVSLRDMLASILRALAKEKVPQAQDWLQKVEAEGNEEQSQQLAITGLKEIARQTGKRFILFIENLDQLLGRNLDDHMKGTLRRLLMTDPFMMIIGSTIQIFDSLKNYDEAFFNYFDPVPLQRLDSKQVSELLRKRAQFDNNEKFLKELPKQQAKVRALVHLTGGNPRFVLMLYELLSLQKVTTIVQYLRRLVDELTPLLKHEMENLPPQQQKIIHALMEKGGTAQPSDLVGPARLPLNAVTTQLKRLKDAQIVEVLGGGKGRAANYTIPDKLFSIWYQMRYLSQNRRRIEMFVEVLRIWFEEEERFQELRSLAAKHVGSPHVLRECAATAEYFAASLKGTAHEKLATDLCIGSWVKADLQEAVHIYADFVRLGAATGLSSNEIAHADLARWLLKHNDRARAIETLQQMLSKRMPSEFDKFIVLIWRGTLYSELGNNEEALNDFGTVIESKTLPEKLRTLAFFARGITKSISKDDLGAIFDLSESIKTGELSSSDTAQALLLRGESHYNLGDFQKSISDYSTIIEMKDAPEARVITALLKRGFTKACPGKLTEDIIALQNALVDFDAALKSENLSTRELAGALTMRGFIKCNLHKRLEAIEDFTKVIQNKEAPKSAIGAALFKRAEIQVSDNPGNAMTDWIHVLDLGTDNKSAFTISGILAFFLSVTIGNQTECKSVLVKLLSNLNVLKPDEANELAIRFLNGIATPSSKNAWPMAWRFLVEGLKPEMAETIRLFEPVVNVLEGKDRSLLDALPPEQREFALKVLEKFTPQTEASQPAKTKYPKKNKDKKTKKT